jgi:cytochrome c
MNSFELNKILGAILGTCLCILALNIGANALFAPEKPAKPGYMIQVKAAPEGGAPEKKEPEKPIAVLLASAKADKGKGDTRVCEACHTFEKGGPNKVGPNLWNIVGSKRGEDRGGFDFSDAMKKKGGTWTYEELNKFLADPRGYIPGTKMTFAGFSRDSQRADVIAYLRTLSDNPQPLPKPTEAAAGGAPAQGGAAPANGAAPAKGGAPAAGGAPAPAGGAAPAKPAAPAPAKPGAAAPAGQPPASPAPAAGGSGAAPKQ